jgi:hypothetical protein
VPASERDSLLRLRQLITGIPQVVEQDPFVCALGVPDVVEAKLACPKLYMPGFLIRLVHCKPTSAV